MPLRARRGGPASPSSSDSSSNPPPTAPRAVRCARQRGGQACTPVWLACAATHARQQHWSNSAGQQQGRMADGPLTAPPQPGCLLHDADGRRGGALALRATAVRGLLWQRPRRLRTLRWSRNPEEEWLQPPKPAAAGRAPDWQPLVVGLGADAGLAALSGRGGAQGGQDGDVCAAGGLLRHFDAALGARAPLASGCSRPAHRIRRRRLSSPDAPPLRSQINSKNLKQRSLWGSGWLQKTEIAQAAAEAAEAAASDGDSSGGEAAAKDDTAAEAARAPPTRSGPPCRGCRGTGQRVCSSCAGGGVARLIEL